jgi:hypothetical protein
MSDDRLISHLLGELRQVTEMRIELARWREWRSGIDRRVDLLETTSKSCQEQLQQHSKSSGLAAKMREHAISLFQWIAVIILAVLSAAKMLPPWVEKLVSALVRVS